MMGMTLGEWRQFVGPRVARFFLAAVFFGLFLFAVESSFVIVFQSFLSAIGLLPQDQLIFSRWVPVTLSGAMLALVAFGIFRALAYMGKAYLGGVVNQAFIRYQREKILIVGLHQAQEIDSAELLNIYSERVPQVAGVINLLAQMLLTFSAAILFTALGARLAPRELLLSLFLLAVILFPLRLLNRRIQALGDGITKNSETMTSILAVGLRNYFFLRVYGLISREINRGLESIGSFEAGYRRFYLLYAARNAVPLMGGIMVVALVSYLGVSHWHTEPVRLVAFLYILLRLGQAASESSALFAELRLQFASVARLRDWHIRMAPEMLNALALQAKRPVQNSQNILAKDSICLEAKELSFRYSGAPAILKNINLSVGRGDLLLIMGPSGAGKSTLLALLLGLREPSGGQILCNGQALAGVREWLASRVGYVGPEPFLVKGSVRQNMLYGNEQLGDFSDAAIWRALREAHLEADIQALPGQLNSELLEHTQLSTGQKQRLAIARALLRNPQLLILDEATANLDAATEQMILQVLAEMRARMAMIVVSHKDSFASIATQKLNLGA